GLVALAAAMKIGYRRLAGFAYPLFVVSALALAFVLISGVGTTIGGARRWVRFFGFSVEPGGVGEVSWVGCLGVSLAKKREKVATFSVGWLPHLITLGILVMLIMAEPDFGSSIGLIFLLFVLLFTAGAKLSYLVGSVLLAIPIAYHAIASSPYRMQ